MVERVDKKALDQIFFAARSHNKWTDRKPSDDLLRELVDLMKAGPTSANCSPMRIIFVCSIEAKQRLMPHLSEGNQAKTRSAPICAILGDDLRFYDHLPKLFPHTDARSWFAGNEEKIKVTAFRNGTLQGAYFMIAARALGLDTGPMSGFDNGGVDREFFPDGHTKSNFLCNIGYGDSSGLFERLPRFQFDDIAKII